MLQLTTGSRYGSGFNKLASVVWEIKRPIFSYSKINTLTVLAAVLAASVTLGSRSGSCFNQLASKI
jgi:hypothetical protein